LDALFPYLGKWLMLKLLIFYLLFFGAAMVLPTVRVWRQTGVNPLVLPSSDNAEGFVGRMFKVVIAELGLYLLLGAMHVIGSIGAIPLPAISAMIGWALLIASFLWVVVAQYQMGRSWRIGIDAKVKTELVATGLFRRSRNPIFLGMIVQLAGLFFVQPDAVTLLALMTGFILISVQIRLEEAHLLSLHGNIYAHYRGTVRRWI
jgi:protein-S-isoprenylcysteine O-methyltransferase Ste14